MSSGRGTGAELWVLFRAAEGGPPERGELKAAVRAWMNQLPASPETSRLRAWFGQGWVLLNVAETAGFPVSAGLALGEWTHLVYLFAEEPSDQFKGLAEKSVLEAAKGLAEYLGGTIHDPRRCESGGGPD